MSAPAATVAPADAVPKAGKKKLIIIILAAVLLLLLAGGGAAFVLLKKKPVDGEDPAADGGHGQADAPDPAAKAHAKHDPKHPPIFVPLDPFTVNLADRETERYAQIGLTLEIDDSKTGDELKIYMPAIRNNILMVLSHRTAAQLLTREGKEKLAKAILHAAVRPLGFEVDDDPEDVADPAAADDANAPAPAKKKKKKAAPVHLPVAAVHFSNFIVQ